ncbi:hypothetical protein HPP92_017249 [Vanilla planifolia]|uniref:Uncharacterized protein n=1 Tax=Vanilla planifolia TaxID=51239 RepID=A0A835UQE4_VANPL|nr:hypothetical protein HPP92_017249 [Vanilla planifolia]
MGAKRPAPFSRAAKALAYLHERKHRRGGVGIRAEGLLGTGLVERLPRQRRRVATCVRPVLMMEAATGKKAEMELVRWVKAGVVGGAIDV